MKITKLAGLAGISIRTLHYYDEIGLLSPLRCDSNNRREYTGNDFLQLYQILYFKNLGFSLSQIKDMLGSSDFDYRKSLQMQVEELKVQKQKIDNRIISIEKIINSFGSTDESISDEQYSKLFNTDVNPYRKEAERLWGSQIVAKSETLINAIPEELKQEISDTMQQQISNLSELSDQAIDSHVVQKAVKNFHMFLNKTHGNLYTLENFSQLGRYYMESKVFRDGLEAIKPGFAQFLNNAIQFYVENINRYDIVTP
jgi:DNA-binding transcriptional MerR regulator